MRASKKNKMVKRKNCRGGYILGYWKGEPVALIPQYHPDSQPGDYIIEEIEVPSDEVIPKIITPETTSLSEIREICEFNDRSFWWITGIDPRDKEAIKIVGSDLLQKAIEYFIAFDTAGTTSTQYRRMFNDLNKEGIIDFNLSVACYLEKVEKINELTLNFSSQKKYNYKIYDMLQSFHRFIKDGKTTHQKKQKEHPRSKVKCPLKKEELELFFKVLISINPIHGLIGKLLWHLNHEHLILSSEGPSVTLESIVKLKEDDLGLDNRTLSFITQTLYYTRVYGTCVADELFEQIVILSKKTDMYIFHNRKGAPIDPSQIRRSFVKASKLAGLSKVITPIHLR